MKRADYNAHLVWRFYQPNVTNLRYSLSRNAYTSFCHSLKTLPLVSILQPYCIHCENTTFRVILKMVPPKKSEKKEPKKRTGDGQMGYLRTRSTRENAYDKKKREIEKWKTSLQLARWRLEYNPLWGKGVLAGPLHSALMWAPFDLLFIFLLFFEQRFPHFSMEGFWRDFQIHWKTPMY